MTRAESISFDHVASLDGVRGVAVAAVVVYHLWPEALPGGFVGVDIFFVLSGFLLTSLLVREVEVTGRVRLGRFFIRRTRRLLPAMLLLLTTLAVYAVTWADAVEIERLRRHGLASLFYVANWLFIADGTTYTDVVAGASPLRHVWSLAIEEQFYVLLAGVVAMVALRRRIIVGAIVVATISAVGMILASLAGSSTDRLYFGSDTRVQALLLGTALGAWLRGRPVTASRRTSALTACAALVLAGIAATASETATWMYRGGFTLTALAAGAVIVGAPATPWARHVLEWRPLASLGAISYGVYLWHWPFLVIVSESRLGLDGVWHRIVIIVSTIAAATLSYRFVEQPIRHGALGRRWGSRAVAVGPAATALVGAALIIGTVTPTALGTQVDAATVAPVIGATVPLTTTSTTSVPSAPVTTDPVSELATATTSPPVPTSTDAAPPTTSTSVAQRTGPLQVMVVGDSVMHTVIGGRLLSGLQAEPWTASDSVFDPSQVNIVNIARPACSFLPGDVAFEQSDGRYETASLAPLCGDWEADLTAASPAIDLVAVLLTNDLADRQIDGSIVSLGSPEHTALLTDFLDRLHRVARRVDAPLVLIVPAPRTEVDSDEIRSDREAIALDVFEQYAARRFDVDVIDAGAVICPDRDCSAPLGGFDARWRYDGLHFSRNGAIWMANWLTPQLESIAAYS